MVVVVVVVGGEAAEVNRVRVPCPDCCCMRAGIPAVYMRVAGLLAGTDFFLCLGHGGADEPRAGHDEKEGQGS